MNKEAIKVFSDNFEFVAAEFEHCLERAGEAQQTTPLVYLGLLHGFVEGAIEKFLSTDNPEVAMNYDGSVERARETIEAITEITKETIARASEHESSEESEINA